jgi:hypothetical protein
MKKPKNALWAEMHELLTNKSILELDRLHVLATTEQQFGIESYKQIRGEVGILLTRIENLFRYCVLGSAAVFAWLLTQAFGVTNGRLCAKLPKEVLLIAWWVPVGIILLCGVLAFGTHLRVMQMSVFLYRCENMLGNSSLSWERFLRPKPSLFFTMTLVAWTLLLLLSIVMALIGLILTPDCYCEMSK